MYRRKNVLEIRNKRIKTKDIRSWKKKQTIRNDVSTIIKSANLSNKNTIMIGTDGRTYDPWIPRYLYGQPKKFVQTRYANKIHNIFVRKGK